MQQCSQSRCYIRHINLTYRLPFGYTFTVEYQRYMGIVRIPSSVCGTLPRRAAIIVRLQDYLYLSCSLAVVAVDYLLFDNGGDSGLVCLGVFDHVRNLGATSKKVDTLVYYLCLLFIAFYHRIIKVYLIVFECNDDILLTEFLLQMGVESIVEFIVKPRCGVEFIVSHKLYVVCSSVVGSDE